LIGYFKIFQKPIIFVKIIIGRSIKVVLDIWTAIIVFTKLLFV
jgi:hypothetical protein